MISAALDNLDTVAKEHQGHANLHQHLASNPIEHPPQATSSSSTPGLSDTTKHPPLGLLLLAHPRPQPEPPASACSTSSTNPQARQRPHRHLPGPAPLARKPYESGGGLRSPPSAPQRREGACRHISPGV